MSRLRLGVILIIVSWLPFAQVFIYVAHNNSKLTTDAASNKFRAVVWGVQILIGFVGLWLAGKTAISVAKQDGWKKTPKNLWQLLRNGEQPAA